MTLLDRHRKSIRLGLASVAAVFGFLVDLFYLADMFGGGLEGDASAILVAIAIFVTVYALASQTEPAAAQLARPSIPPSADKQPSVTLNAPVSVQVPVEVRIEREQAPPKPVPIASGAKSEAVELPDIPRRAQPADEDASVLDLPPVEEILFDEVVEVNPGREGAWYLELALGVGDVLEGNLREVDLNTFHWMIVNERNLARFLNGDECDIVAGEGNVKAGPIRWTCRRVGRWYLVIDAYGKQYAREVQVVLRRITVP